MLSNLLFKVDGSLVADAALYALLGFAVVFLGIAILIFVVWLVGKIMPKIENGVEKSQEKKKNKKAQKESKANEVTALESVSNAEDGVLDEETIAVITAAIMAYYQKENPKCEFTVKRIKRI